MADVYNIAVKIAATNGVSSVLRVMQRDLFGLNQTVDLTSSKFKAMSVVVGGAMAAIAGTAALKGMTKLITAGDKIIQQQQRLRELGLGDGAVNNLTSTAVQVATSTPGYSISQTLGTQNDLMRSLAKVTDANAVLKSTTQDMFAIQQVTGDQSDKGILSAIKTVDVQGGATKNHKIDAGEFAKNLKAMSAAIVVANGLLSPQQILQITRMAGPTAQGGNFANWIFSNLSAFINLARISGRAINMAGRDLLAGYSTKVSAREGIKLGLYGKDAVTKDFNRYYINPEKVVGGDVLTDPNQGIPAWVQKVLLPRLQSHGFVTPQEISAEILRLIPNQTAQRYISQESVAYVQQQRDMSLALGSNGSNLYELAQQTVKAQMQDFTASWQSLIEALGMPMVQTAVNAMQGVTATINTFALWAMNHQNAIKIIDSILIGLASALAILGGVAIIGALTLLVGASGSVGLIGGLIAGIIGLVAAFVALDNAFPRLDNAIPRLDNAIPRLFNAGTAADRQGIFGAGSWVPNIASGNSSNGAIPVVITNPHDIAHATKTGLSGSLAAHQGYPRGTTGTNTRRSFPGTAGLATP